MNKLVKKVFDENVDIEEAAQILYYFKQTRSKLIDEVYNNINQKTMKRFDEVMQKLDDFVRKVERIQNTYRDKIKSKKFIRVCAKDLINKYKNAYVSQTSLIELLVDICMDILNGVCQNEFKMIIDEDLLDLFFETVQSNQHLKEEFHIFLNDIVGKFIMIPPSENDELEEKHIDMYTKGHGLYLTKLRQNKLSNEKLNIQIILNYTREDLKTIVKNEQLKDKEYDEILNNQEQKNDEETVNEMIKELKVKHQEMFEEHDEKEVAEFIRQIINHEIEDHPYLDRFIEKFDLYFNYDQNQDYHEYANLMEVIQDTYDDKEFEDTYQYIMSYLFLTSEEYSEKHECEEEVEEILHYILSTYFMELLAYHIHTSDKLNDEKKKEMIQEFIKILVNNESCKENYNDETKSNITIPGVYKYLPIDQFYNRIISSVLYELHDKRVLKDVKRILNKYFGKKDDLNKLCRKQTELYDNYDFMELIAKGEIHEFAVAFVHYYAKDNLYMSSYCPFTRFAQDILLEYFKLEDYDKKEFYTILVENPKELDMEELTDTKKAYEFLHSIMEDETEDDDLFIDDSIKSILYFIQSNDYDMSHFLDIDNLDRLFKKHEALLLQQVEIHLRANEFQNKSLLEQKRMIWRIAIDIELMSEIEKMNEFLPTLEDLENRNKVKELEKMNKSLNHEIHDLNKTIHIYEKEIQKVKSNTKEIIKKEVDNSIQSYHSEIIQLNKRIKELEKENHSLNENNHELYKLRELFFNIHHDIEDDHEQSYDLSELIKDKSIVIIAGHIHLIKRLKDKYPNIKNVQLESQITQELIKNADHVFIFTDFSKHGLYYKAMKYINKYQIKWDYMIGVNIDNVEKEMWNKLKENE